MLPSMLPRLSPPPFSAPPRIGPQPRTQARHRELLGRPDRPRRTGEGRGRTARATPGRAGATPAWTRCRSTRSPTTTRCSTPRCMLGALPARVAGYRRRPGPLLRRGPRQQRRRAAGDDQVVRHQLPLPRPRDRPGHRVLAEPGQGARRARRGPRARRSDPPGRSSARSRSCCWARPSTAAPAPARPARRAGRRSTPSCCRKLAAAGAEWVQLDEPALVTDIVRRRARAAPSAVYDALLAG